MGTSCTGVRFEGPAVVFVRELYTVVHTIYINCESFEQKIVYVNVIVRVNQIVSGQGVSTANK